MNNIHINGKQYTVDENKTILSIAKENNIEIPTLCFLGDCSNTGKCGVCRIEVEGQEELIEACSNTTVDGMKIRTNSKKVQLAVKNRITELLNNHNFRCGECKRRESCEFLKLIIRTGGKLTKLKKELQDKKLVDDRSHSIVLDRSKCLRCGRCVSACKSKIGTEAIKFQENENGVIVGPEGLKCFDDTNCLLCGQCVAACPVDALSEKSHLDRVKDALKDPNMNVVVGMAPSVRTALGETFKMDYGTDVTKKIYTALRELGFNKVFDVNFAADMTIMEEGTELIGRIAKNGPFPMFTSCCPAWIRLVENYYPNLLDNLSTAKSPQQMFGAASKTYYSNLENIDPKNVFTVTIMPCTAKKYEADRSEMYNDGIKNVDAVLNTRELARLIKESNIDFANLQDSEVDLAMGQYTGAATLFGVTGGVMEAALRTAKDLMENTSLENVDYEVVRGFDGVKEATVNIAGNDYNIAIIHGASNLFEFINSGKINEKQYHFIEVMVCPGGCVNGGGQPHISSTEREVVDIKDIRGNVLYGQDKSLELRKSHKNPAIQKMYADFMGEPGHGKAHELLHVKYTK